MKKSISLLLVLIMLFLCSNLFAGSLYVDIWNATGYEMNGCCIYLNSSLKVSGATWQPGFIPYVFEVDDPSSVSVWAYGYADCYGWEFYANGEDYSYWNPNTQHWEAFVEIDGVDNPSQINFSITVNNEIDEAHNCSLIRNPNTNPETLFANQTISAGTTTYTEYEICVDDELKIEGDVDGFYYGQIYDVSDLEVVDYDYNSSTYILEIYATLDLEYDDTPPDYDYNTTNLSSSGWNWVSFPVLDPDYDDPIDYVLEPILDDLEEVVHDQDYIYWTGTSWQNNIGDFQSIDGYKIQMDDDAELEVAGWVEDPDTEIPLYEEEENWIGYFIPYSQSPSWAFGDAWQYLNCIQAEDWSMYKKNGIWYGPAGVTMDFGDGYVVWVDDDCTLEWVCFGQMKSYEKPESQYFSYEEKASYEAIDITGIDESVLEIGVFENDICVGASVVENGFAQILAYTENVNKEGSELTFQIISGKGDKQEICTFYVYDFDKNTYIKKNLISGNQEYSLVRLNKGEENQTPIELSISQNIPNPFSSNTLISYSIPKESRIEISVYNLKGQRVKTLVNEILSAGNYSTVWNGTDDKGKTLPNGVYLYKLDNDDTSISKKVIIMH